MTPFRRGVVAWNPILGQRVAFFDRRHFQSGTEIVENRLRGSRLGQRPVSPDGVRRVGDAHFLRAGRQLVDRCRIRTAWTPVEQERSGKRTIAGEGAPLFDAPGEVGDKNLRMVVPKAFYGRGLQLTANPSTVSTAPNSPNARAPSIRVSELPARPFASEDFGHIAIG